ncbi:MAG: outer membrane protein assembly factor BamA [Tenuifilaceae bacterium]
MFRKFALLTAALICIIFALPAQDLEFSYTTPQKYFIKDITISGVKFLDPIVLVSVSGLSVGDSITIPGDDITKPIRKLWSQGLFSDVKISASKVEGENIYLDIYLQERPRISSINFEGIRKGEIDDLKELLKLRAGGQITESILENSVRLIKKHYRSKGFLNTSIDVLQANDTTYANGVKITFDIKKNDKVKISDITFEGNEKYSATRLRRAMKKTHRRDYNIFKASKFVESDYDDDKIGLITFYNEHGYRDAKVISDSIFNVNEKRIGIHIKLVEGPQYHIRNIYWLGNTKLNSDALTAYLGMKKGDVYDKSMLEKRLFSDETSISTLYMDDGYLFFQIDPVENNVERDSVDLEMRISEGDQATVNRVTLAGNTKTNEHVVRRELFTKPGDLFSKSEIQRSIRYLAQLGHFDPEKLDVKPEPNVADGTVDLRYILEEKANDQFEISGGWGANMFVGTVGIRFSNFAIRRAFDKGAWRPVPSGDSQSLTLRASTNGTYYKAFSVSFTEPWLGGRKPTNFSFSLYHTIQSGATYAYQTSDKFFKVTGASVGIGTRLKWPDDWFQIYHEVSLQNYLLRNWSSGSFLFTDGNSNNFSFKTTLSRNSTDQQIYPRRGSNFSLSLQITPPYSSFKKKSFWLLSDAEKVGLTESEITLKEQSDRYHWIEYHKWSGRAQWYLALVQNLVLYTNAQFGMLGYFSENLGYSPFEGFDLGGDGMSGYNLYGRETIGLRGYENGTLTPIVNNARTANIYNKYTMEIRYPLSLKPQAAIYVHTFFEAGNAWHNFDEFNPFNIHRSVGFGARMFLPMLGMLGIDWGYGLDAVRNQPSANKGQFHFVIGMPF